MFILTFVCAFLTQISVTHADRERVVTCKKLDVAKTIVDKVARRVKGNWRSYLFYQVSLAICWTPRWPDFDFEIKDAIYSGESPPSARLQKDGQRRVVTLYVFKVDFSEPRYEHLKVLGPKMHAKHTPKRVSGVVFAIVGKVRVLPDSKRKKKPVDKPGEIQKAEAQGRQ